MALAVTLAVPLAAVVLGGAPAQAAPACVASQADEVSATRMAKACASPVEVLSARSEFAQVMANPDGTSTLTTSAVPRWVHRQDGSWAAADPTLRVRSDGWLAPVAAVSDMAFSPGGDGPFATYRDQGSLLTLSLPVRLPKPKLEGSTAVYANVQPGVDLRVTASTTSFRPVFVLKTRAATTSGLRLVVGGDVVARGAGDGRLRFVNGKGKTVAVSDTATMWDSAVRPGEGGEPSSAATPAMLQALRDAPPAALVSTEHGPGATARSAKVGVAADADGRSISLQPDAALLADQSATLPLFVDPQIGPQENRWAYTRSVDSNYTMDGRAWMGKNPPPGDGSLFRAFFDFPTTSDSMTIKGKQIVSASFSINLWHSYSCGNTAAYLYGANNITVANGARMSWNSQPMGYNTRYLGTAWGHASKTGNCSGGVQPDMIMTFGNTEEMRADVQRAATGNWETYTVGLSAADNAGGNDSDESTTDRWKKFTVDSHTTLSVTFNTIPGAPANLSPHQGQAACGGVVGTYSPVLQAQYVDADIQDNLSATFAWQELPSGPINTVAGASRTANNNGTVTLNLGSSAEGKQYQFRVQTFDGHDYSPWSDWCTFTIDTNAPEAPDITATASGTAPVYVRCDPANVSTCTPLGGPGIAGAFRFSEPAGRGIDVIRYVYGWDSPSVSITVAAGAATAPILLTPPRYGLNRLTAYSVDGAGHHSETTSFYFLVDAPSGAVAYWPLDSIDSHGFVDLMSDQEHPLALAASNVTWTPDARYYGFDAATFSGSNSQAIQSVTSFDTSGSFSVAAWVRLASLSCSGNTTAVAIDADPVAANNHTSAFLLSYDCVDVRWRMRIAAQNVTAPLRAEAVSANNSAVAGRWTFVVGTYDEAANVIKLWLDGVLVSTVTPSAEWVAAHGTGWKATGPVTIGRDRSRDADGGRFAGEIADVRLWNRALVQQDIVGADADPADGVFASQTGLAAPRVVGQWLFSDGEYWGSDSPDTSGLSTQAFDRRVTLVPNFNNPDWTGDPTTAPARYTEFGHEGIGGLTLDGLSGYASTTDDSGTTLDTSDDKQHPILHTDQSFTVSAWVKLDDADPTDPDIDLPTHNWTVLAQSGNYGSAFYLGVRVDSGTPLWSFMIPEADGVNGDDPNQSAGHAVANGPAITAGTIGTWVHLEASYDAASGAMRLYVNDTLAGLATRAAKPFDTHRSLTIGSALFTPVGQSSPLTTDYGRFTVDAVTVYQGLTPDTTRYSATVLNSAPRSYWRLNDESGTVARSSVAGNAGVDNGTYVSVALGQTGPMVGATAAGFSSGSAVTLPTTAAATSTNASVSLWFKTTQPGPLWGEASQPFGSTTVPNYATAPLYVGSDGRLRGGFTALPNAALLVGLNGKCLDNNGGRPDTGNPVGLYICTGNPIGQTWMWYPDGTLRILGKCLNIHNGGTGNGTKTDLWDCNGGSSQVWQLVGGSVRNPASGRCLDVPGANDQAIQLQIYDCNGTPGQTWSIRPLTAQTPVMIMWQGGACLDNNGGRSQNGNPISLYYCTGNPIGNMWTWRPNGALELAGIAGKCLDVSGAGTANGTLVQLWDCNGSSAQVWQRVGNTIVNPPSGRCLHGPASFTEGVVAQLQIWDCNGSVNQQWWAPYSGSLASASTVTDGNWHHAVLSAAGNLQVLYLDGQFAGTLPGEISHSNPAYTMIGAAYTRGIGPAQPGWTSLTGSIAEVSVWDRSITAQDVTTLYAAAM